MNLTLLCWMWCKFHRLRRIKDGFEADWIFAPNLDLDNFWTRLTFGLNLRKILNFVLDCSLDLSVSPDGILNDEIETLTFLMIFFFTYFFWISDKNKICNLCSYKKFDQHMIVVVLITYIWREIQNAKEVEVAT